MLSFPVTAGSATTRNRRYWHGRRTLFSSSPFSRLWSGNEINSCIIGYYCKNFHLGNFVLVNSPQKWQLWSCCKWKKNILIYGPVTTAKVLKDIILVQGPLNLCPRLSHQSLNVLRPLSPSKRGKFLMGQGQTWENISKVKPLELFSF